MIDKELISMEKSEWKGYCRYDYVFDGRECIVIAPKEIAEKTPWVWRAEFFDAFAQADMALLNDGWHIAYYHISDMYGCPRSIELMRNFYNDVIRRFNLSSKADLFGFSRGGLYATNYAVRYPKTVSTLYLDAPVLDIKSWPGGMGVGLGAEKEWKECLTVYNLDEESVNNFCDRPIDKMDLLKCPIILVAGDSDDVVPYCENGAILAEKYTNNKIKVIVKPGVAHHPHSLDDTSIITDFIKEYR